MIEKTELIKEQGEKLAKLTFLLARACEEKEQYFIQKYNLSPAEFRCMRFLKDSCAFTVKELASQMRLSPGRVTQILTTLEEKNFITREIDKKDRRNIKVCTTPNADDYIKNVIDEHNELHENVLIHIDENSRENVLLAMEELLSSLLNWSKSNNNSDI
ncbi:MAG: MarR family transcriptional regulator [Candidatus Kapabacteria bacterium]|nr:MarR family transcriptional regulator [Candidatus Kapabacteria bacterium]